uniref:G_PROTEIN_RECEP_F1_2 domain-containing protein n=1 Tax=Caenorhabditis tropicalis TaxID=1561998 RepID=A0A1I7U9N9_9PELO
MQAIIICPFLIILIGLIAAHPHAIAPGMCMQMFGQYPFGSVVVISTFGYFHAFFVEIVDMSFISLTSFSIIILNFLMIKKLRERKNLVALKSTSQNTSIERSLTGSMIILLIPLLIHFLIAGTILFGVFSFAPSLVSHGMLIRPLALDLRVHGVTLYFYYTHPVFKERKIINTVSSNLRS